MKPNWIPQWESWCLTMQQKMLMPFHCGCVCQRLRSNRVGSSVLTQLSPDEFTKNQRLISVKCAVIQRQNSVFNITWLFAYNSGSVSEGSVVTERVLLYWPISLLMNSPRTSDWSVWNVLSYKDSTQFLILPGCLPTTVGLFLKVL